MYAPEFDYHRAASVAEAIQLLGSHEDAKLLAGGQSLIPLMKLRLARPAVLVDIGRIADLKGISVNGDTIRIGGLTTHHEIASSAEIKNANPMLAEAAAGIGDQAVRNRGTIGGNLAHADPASDWGTVLTALDASIDIQGPSGSRSVSLDDFFQGAFTTALAENEVVTGVNVPVLSVHDHGHDHGHEHEGEHGHDHGHDHASRDIHGQVGEYAKMAHPASFFAVVGGAVVVTVADQRCTAARVAVGGLVPSPLRARSVENALVGKELSAENITSAVEHLADDLGD
ncbi:MAG: FAD binding domain-containing protein, partial [Dehalococcoidia bacterium]